MKQNKNESMKGNISEKRDLEEDLKDWYYQNYPNHAKHHDNIKTRLLLPIIIIVLILAFFISLYYLFICSTSGGWILDSAEFYYDSEAEIDGGLLNELYYNLDADSRMNVTNDTYFLVLSIPELDYTIRFDYLFEFIAENQTNLSIEQHSKVPKMTSFEPRYYLDEYNMSIEFCINSLDHDILNVTIFPPDNIIYGKLSTHTADSWLFFIELEEGEVMHEDMESEILVLPYNHRIKSKASFHHNCPFK